MRTSVTLRWIEQAEAAQVLTAACFETTAALSWRRRAADALADWRDRVTACVAPPHTGGWPAWQLQPVRVRTAQPRPRYLDDDYRCHR
jgi:hypothetical protein